MAKKALKASKKQHVDHHIRHRIILGVGTVVIAALIGLVLTLVIIPKITNDARLARINEIYSSIKLPENTYFNEDKVFGDKRVYEYDEGRSFSSMKKFVVAKTVTETTTLMDKAIKDAGYVFFEESYPGSVSKEYHYKTSRGEYIRLNVSSKSRNDAGSNEILMTGNFSESFFKLDPNAGPSTVILKVNLDDNNE